MENHQRNAENWLNFHSYFCIIMGWNTRVEIRNKKQSTQDTLRKNEREWKLFCIRPYQNWCECSWKPQNMRKDILVENIHTQKIEKNFSAHSRVSHFQSRLLCPNIKSNVLRVFKKAMRQQKAKNTEKGRCQRHKPTD